MGIQAEFNPDLALRDMDEFRLGRRKKEECVPEDLKKGNVYEFLKSGQRLYWLNEDPFWSNGEIPLCKTKGDKKLSRPLASIKILEATHFLKDGEVWTKGKYEVKDVFDITHPKVHFEGVKRIR